MPQVFYPAIFLKGRRSGYTIRLFDFPEAFAEADTLAQATWYAEDALALSLEVWSADLEPLPAPSDVSIVTEFVTQRLKKERKAYVRLIPGHVPDAVVRLSVTQSRKPAMRIKRPTREHGKSGRSTRAPTPNTNKVIRLYRPRIWRGEQVVLVNAFYISKKTNVPKEVNSIWGIASKKLNRLCAHVGVPPETKKGTVGEFR